ncbi:MAG TPA: aspartate/glutamate racemase family protein [Herpetosiphonaceae bacterium]
MRHTLAIIHTTAVTVEPLRALAAELLPQCEVINFVDDSILPQLRRNGGDVSAVADRLRHYARFAEDVGAAIILSACSSVGEVVPQMQQQVAIPVVRIDEAMAEEAARRGRRIGVVATLATTLSPTMLLVQRKASADAVIVPLLVDTAYQKLVAGDAAGHDADLAEALGDLAASVDVVVLAQASMARVVPSLPQAAQQKCLSSPRLGMARVQAVLAARDRESAARR